MSHSDKLQQADFSRAGSGNGGAELSVLYKFFNEQRRDFWLVFAAVGVVIWGAAFLAFGDLMKLILFFADKCQ